MLTGYKSYLAGAGLLGLALYEASQSHYHDAALHASSGLAVLGVAHKLERLIAGILGGSFKLPS